MLGDRVKALREARAWTQEHLAEAAGVSLRTIQRLENGSGFASETALAIAAALSIDVRELLEASPADEMFRRSAHLLVPAGVARKMMLTVALAMMLPAVLFALVFVLRRYAGIAVPDFEMLDSPMVVIGPPMMLLTLWWRARRPDRDWEVPLPLSFR